QERGSTIDVGGAYNTVFLTIKHAGARTSLIVDPPDGRIPPQTPAAQRAAAADREFRLVLLQSTDACKNKAPACAAEVRIEDPTVWTRAWTVKQEFARQSDEDNRIYYEPRCIEGNLGLPGLLYGRRVEERAFAEGRGPDPRTTDSVGGVLSVQTDPLQ